MAFESVHNLLVRITGENSDLLSTLEGSLSGIGKLAIGAYALKTAFDMVSNGISAVKESILAGGDFNESFTGIQTMAESLNRSTSAYVQIIQDISAGTQNLAESVTMAGKAMKFGFNEDQFKAIATYSKRYTESFGGDWTQMAYTIETALATGRTMALKEFGIMAEAGMPMSNVMKQIAENTVKLGEGAYNISDDLISLGKVMDSVSQSFGIANNRMMGEAGFGDAFAWLREGMMGLVDLAPRLASGFMQIADLLFGDLFSSVKTVYSGFTQLFEMLFSYPFKVREQIGLIGTDLLIFVTDVISSIKAMWLDSLAIMAEPLLRLLSFANSTSSWVREKLGITTEESKRQYQELSFFIEGVRGMGDVVRQDQEKFAKQLRDTPPLFRDIEKVSTKGLEMVAQGFEKATGKADAAKKEVQGFFNLWDSADKKVGSVLEKYTLWDASKNKVGELNQGASGQTSGTKPLWDDSVQKKGELYLNGRPTAGAEGRDMGVGGSANSGVLRVVFEKTGDPFLDLIITALNKAARAEGGLRAGQ